MIFRETVLPGVRVVEVEELADVRGFFARTWCEREFAKQGLASRMVQASVSYNKKKGTLRGMHYQAYPSEEGVSSGAPEAPRSTPWSTFARTPRRSSGTCR